MSLSQPIGVMGEDTMQGCGSANSQNFYDCEPRAIPVPLVLEAIRKSEYANVLGLAIQYRFMTGCRGKELDHTDPNKQSNGSIFWRLGKNQTKHFRKEHISEKWWAEYDFYRHKQGVPTKKLFHICNNTLQRYFNRDLRPILSAAWNEKIPVMRKNEICLEYRYQWSGFRKTFQTLLFAYYWTKYDDANIAMEMVSKRMKHSSTGMTVKHYIDDCDAINAKAYIGMLPFDLVNQPRQECIYEWFE